MLLKISLFILLKVLEIVAIVFVPYWVGRITTENPVLTFFEYWLSGATIVLATGVVIYLISPFNWQLVERMVR